MGKLFVLLLGLLWAQTDAAWASVFNAKVPGKWPAGQITWYYNPTGRPANLADAEVIAAVSTALAGKRLQPTPRRSNRPSAVHCRPLRPARSPTPCSSSPTSMS